MWKPLFFYAEDDIFYFIANMTKKFNSKCDLLCCVALLLLYSFAFSDFHFIAVGLIIFVLFCFVSYFAFINVSSFFSVSLINRTLLVCACVTSIPNGWWNRFWFSARTFNTWKKIRSAPFKWKTHEMWQVCLKWTRKARFVIKLLFDIDWIFLCFSMFCYGSMIMQKKKTHREETKS